MGVVVQYDAAGAEAHSKAKFLSGFCQVPVDVSGFFRSARHAGNPEREAENTAKKHERNNGALFWMGRKKGFVIKTPVDVGFVYAGIKGQVNMVFFSVGGFSQVQVIIQCSCLMGR